MRESKLLYENAVRVKQRFEKSHPAIVQLVQQSFSATDFKQGLTIKIEERVCSFSHEDYRRLIAENLIRLIEYDEKELYELSSDSYLVTEPISLFWQFLSDNSLNSLDGSLDFLIDLFQQIDAIFRESNSVKPISKQSREIRRWRTGLDAEVIEIRAKSKHRIIAKLIQKIEHINSLSSRYHFEAESSYEEKYRLVEQWWELSHFHLTMAIKSPRGLQFFLDDSLSKDTLVVLNEARKKGVPFFVTPYYLSLLDIDGVIDDAAIRTYIIYSKELVDAYGSIKAWEKEDQVEAGKPNAAGWLLPDGHNIHRRYPEVAILIPDSMGRACGGLCASCQRMYDFQSERLNFDLDALKPKEGWSMKLDRLMTYFEEDTQLRDILITGGDALMSQNATLRNILAAVYEMANRKRKANQKRNEGERYAELQRVRIGTRLLAYLPMRITDELIEILRDFRLKAQQIGIVQFVVQTHFQSPLEVTPEAKRAIQATLRAGWIITNQSVYTVAASRRGHAAQLRKMLNELGVICYYNFTVKGFAENYTMFTPNGRSLQEMNEEKMLGRLSKEQEEELKTLLLQGNWSGETMKRFLRKHHLPFVATDRNTLNLPGIGKSMTFTMVGLLPDGRRILRFEHDHTRRHSPMVEQMEPVYIAENKSIAAYLRQLERMGERCEDYHSLWYYSQGDTEPRFSFFDYPEFDFVPISRFNHIP